MWWRSINPTMRSFVASVPCIDPRDCSKMYKHVDICATNGNPSLNAATYTRIQFQQEDVLLSKSEATDLCRFRSGNHPAPRSWRNLISWSEETMYRLCGNEEESYGHLLLRCPALDADRQRLLSIILRRLGWRRRKIAAPTLASCSEEERSPVHGIHRQVPKVAPSIRRGMQSELPYSGLKKTEICTRLPHMRMPVIVLGSPQAHTEKYIRLAQAAVAEVWNLVDTDPFQPPRKRTNRWGSQTMIITAPPCLATWLRRPQDHPYSVLRISYPHSNLYYYITASRRCWNRRLNNLNWKISGFLWPYCAKFKVQTDGIKNFTIQEKMSKHKRDDIFGQVNRSLVSKFTSIEFWSHPRCIPKMRFGWSFFQLDYSTSQCVSHNILKREQSNVSNASEENPYGKFMPVAFSPTSLF